MIFYNDMVYCSSETCTNTECERNKKHIPEYAEVPAFFMDFENFCTKYDNKVVDNKHTVCYNEEKEDGGENGKIQKG